MTTDEARITTVFINNLSDLFQELNNFEPKIKDACQDKNIKFLLWYRGQANSQYPLVPSLYRKYSFDGDDKTRNFWDVVHDREKYYINDFRIRNYHLISHEPENKLTLMSIMQHYGTPTRLMDWSESLLAALFFALEDYFSSERKNENVLPCIWCLKPFVLNQMTIHKYKLRIPDENLPDMLSMLPSQHSGRERSSYKNLEKYYMQQKGKPYPNIPECWPLAVIPPCNNERIHAQSGTFTLFPISTKQKVDDIKIVSLENLPNSYIFLRQFILIKPAHISFEIKAAGVKRSMFYPEMVSYSYDIEQELNLNFR